LRTAQSGGSAEPTGPTVVPPPAPAATPPAGQAGEATVLPSDGETVPAATARTDNGSRKRRRGGKRRVLVATTVAVTASAAAVTGVIYATSDHGTSTPGTGARKSPSSPAPPYSPPPWPKGFHQVSELGATFPVPDGWKVANRSGELVTYSDKSGRVGITVKKFAPA